MNSRINGVAFTAAELRTLLKFASRESTDRDKYGIKVVVQGDRCWARATNGQNSLELDGESDGQLQDGEWFVHREYIERAVKLVVGVKAVLRLCFSGASLNHAIVEENDLETGSFDVPKEAAVADVSFPWATASLKPPSRNRKIAHCSAIAGANATLLEDVESALGCNHSDLYPPVDPETPWVFVVNDAGQTVARGTLRATASVASTKGDGNEEDEGDDEKPRRGRKGKGDGRQQEIAH